MGYLFIELMGRQIGNYSSLRWVRFSSTRLYLPTLITVCVNKFGYSLVHLPCFQNNCHLRESILVLQEPIQVIPTQNTEILPT